MNISKRLKTIASLVDTKRVIDVGCDHGYLDIYLTICKNCKCVATDISRKAIQSCINNLKIYNLTDKIDVLIKDGIDGIDINKDDTIVLSGMGTNTIIDILAGKHLSDNLIISSNNHLEELRRYIIGLGYYIADEKYIKEHNIHYVIIKFKKGTKKYSEFDYVLGPIVIKDASYRKYILNHYLLLLKKIPNTHIYIRDEYKKIVNYIKSNYS